MSSAPVTPAIHFLRQNSVPFTPHVFRYEERGGTSVSSKALGVEEHIVIKTLIMQTETRDPLIVLMHGDCQVSTKELARAIGCKSVSPCAPEVADRHSGYQVGGTSPFGTRKSMPVYLQKTILDFPEIFINGGAKGFLVQIDPREIVRTLQPKLVEVAIAKNRYFSEGQIMKARLFVGFSVQLESSLTAALKRLKIGAQRHEMAMNWTPLANLHVTTNFLGETDRSEIPRLLDLLSVSTRETAPLSTSLRGLGAFPDEHHMRVLWAGVRKSRDLSQLQSHLREVLLISGFPQEDREFAPHLTLGRLRKARSGQDLISPFVRTSFQDVEISNVTLFENVLHGHGQGPVYKILGQLPLEGAHVTPDAEPEIA